MQEHIKHGLHKDEENDVEKNGTFTLYFARSF
jgi:hypothetical protein